MDRKYSYRNWMENTEDSELKNQLTYMTKAEIITAFNGDLEFGTGGLRAVTGAGTNRMNIHTVNKATQGLCDFLKSQTKFSSVAIAYDSYIDSEQFARSAAEVIAGNAGKAHILTAQMPTTVLSYMVRKLGCNAGIVISASHNPAEYNDYKVFGSDGGQITNQAANSIQRFISQVDIFYDVKKQSFRKAISEGAISFVSQYLVDEYLDKAEKYAINTKILKESDINEIYSIASLVNQSAAL